MFHAHFEDVWDHWIKKQAVQEGNGGLIQDMEEESAAGRWVIIHKEAAEELEKLLVSQDVENWKRTGEILEFVEKRKQEVKEWKQKRKRERKIVDKELKMKELENDFADAISEGDEEREGSNQESLKEGL